jgi:hypothetical protein
MTSPSSGISLRMLSSPSADARSTSESRVSVRGSGWEKKGQNGSSQEMGHVRRYKSIYASDFLEKERGKAAA